MAAPDWLPTRFMQEEFDKTLQGEVGQQREAGHRLHSLGQLLSARRRFAVVRRKEISDDRHRQPMARRFRRGRSLSQAQQIYRRRSGIAGDHRGHASGAAVDFVVLSLQVDELLRLPAVPRQSGDGVPQGSVLQRDRTRQFQEAVQSDPALLLQRMGRRRLGPLREHRQVLPAQEGRQARRRRGRRRFLRHRLSDGKAV